MGIQRRFYDRRGFSPAGDIRCRQIYLRVKMSVVPVGRAVSSTARALLQIQGSVPGASERTMMAL